MRSSTLVLLFLISVQAALNMGEDAPAPPTHHPHHHHHPQQQQQHQRRKTAQQSQSQSRSQSRPLGRRRSRDAQADLIPTVDTKLFNKRRYRSPRVIFSDVVPPDNEPVGLVAGREQGQGWDRGPRVRRQAEQLLHRGEYSVCDSVNHWVGNMTHATDMAGHEVTVLPDVRIDNVVKKQLFYETTCRFATKPSGGGGGAGGKGGGGGGKWGNGSRGGGKSGSSSSGCRGIDSRHWNSYCTNTHTYVRALTIFKKQITWRFIRINAACVCVLSRKTWRG